MANLFLKKFEFFRIYIRFDSSVESEIHFSDFLKLLSSSLCYIYIYIYRLKR